MKHPDDPDEWELVIKALTCGVGGCVEWDPGEADRVRSDPYLKGLLPERIQADLIDHAVETRGSTIRQVKEHRDRYLDRREFYYKTTLTCYQDLFRRGLFVEMELVDRDEDYPVVHILNAHEQNR